MSNPASRLFYLLKKAKNNSIRAKPMMLAWREILDLPKQHDDFKTMQIVTHVLSLPNEVEKQISSYADLNSALFCSWVPEVNRAFKTINFSSKMATLESAISQETMVKIEFCDHELTKRMNDKEIDPVDLSALREKACELLDEILSSDTDPSVNQYLSDLAFRLINAIDCYQITGSIEIQRALDMAVGSLLTTSETAQNARQTNIGKKFWDIAGKIVILLNLANNTAKLLENASTLISSK